MLQNMPHREDGREARVKQSVWFEGYERAREKSFRREWVPSNESVLNGKELRNLLALAAGRAWEKLAGHGSLQHLPQVQGDGRQVRRPELRHAAVPEARKGEVMSAEEIK